MLVLIYLVLDCCLSDDKERENPFVLLPKIDKYVFLVYVAQNYNVITQKTEKRLDKIIPEVASCSHTTN